MERRGNLRFYGAVVTMTQSTNTSGSDEAVDIGAFRQLFLDNHAIAESDGVIRQVTPAQKYAANPIVTADRPWDRLPLIYGSVIFDPKEGYRMWYFTWDKRGGLRKFGDRYGDRGFVGYARSDDGLRWEKPELDIVEYEGQKTNCVIGPADIPNLTEFTTVLHDPQDPDESRRYKMIYKYKRVGPASPHVHFIEERYADLFADLENRGRGDLVAMYREVFEKGLFLSTQTRAMGTVTSPDGIHWQRPNSMAIPEIHDMGYMTFDPYRRRYLFYGRDFFIPERLYAERREEPWFRDFYWGRATRLVESDDFEHWRVKGLVLKCDEQDLPYDEIYFLSAFPYEGLFIGLVEIYHGSPEGIGLDIQLAVSRDGEKWQRMDDRQPFIPLGGIGEWDRFNTSMASHPVFVGDEVRFYYSGRTRRHSPYFGNDTGPQETAIGLATVPRDRFVSCGASFDGGVILTKPLTGLGTSLHFNLEAAYGSVRVTLLDRHGKPLGTRFEIRADSLDETLDLAPDQLQAVRSGAPVSLRFNIYNARLYSFWST